MLEIIELYCDDNVYSNSQYLYLLCKINKYYLLSVFKIFINS